MINRIRLDDIARIATTNPNTGKRRRGLSKSTAKKYTVAANRLIDFFGNGERDVTTITPGELWEWQEHLNHQYTNAATTNSYRATVRAMWRQLRKQGIAVCDTTELFEMRPEERGVKAISELNYWKELVSSGLRDAAMTCLVTESGIRRGGLAGMKISTTEIWSQPDIGMCLATRVVEKGDKPRIAFGLDLSASLVKSWLDVRKGFLTAMKVTDHDYVWIATDSGQPLSYHSFGNVFEQLKERARIGKNEPTNCHSMRHRFAINKLMAGMPLSIVSKLLGHTDITTTDKVYTTMTDEEIKQVFFDPAFRS